MDKMPLISLIFYSIPESFLIFAFGQVVTGQMLNPPKLLLTSIVSAGLSFLVRYSPILFGIQYIFSFIVISLMFYFVFKMNIKKSIIATLISLGMLLFLENTVLYLIQIILNFSLEDIWKEPLLRTIIGWPHLIIWSVITYVLYKKKIHLNNIGVKF